MDDPSVDWSSITHFRVAFKSYEKFANEAESHIRDWPKPLTIEWLEEQYATRWKGDLMSVCWDGREVRGLGQGDAGHVTAEPEDYNGEGYGNLKK